MQHPAHPSVAELEYLLSQARSEGRSDRVIQRLQCLLYYWSTGSSVTETCQHFGISRNSFYRLLRRFDAQDITSLEDAAHAQQMQTTLPEEAKAVIHKLRWEMPHIGKEKIRLILERDYDMHVSVSAIGRFISREKLFFGDTPLHRRKQQESEMHTRSQPAYVMVPAMQAYDSQHKRRFLRTFFYGLSGLGVFFLITVIVQLVMSWPLIVNAQVMQTSLQSTVRTTLTEGPDLSSQTSSSTASSLPRS